MSCPTHPAAPTPHSASSGRRCLVGECGFSASWTGCTRWLCPESVLGKPEDLNKQTTVFLLCFPAFSDTVLTRLLWVLFLGRNTSRAEITKGTVYPDTTRLYSLQCYRSLLSSPSPPAKQARNLVNRGSCLWCDPCVCARARCDALVCLPTKKKVKLRKFPESCVKIIYANSVTLK